MTMPAATYVVTRGYKPGVTDKVYASRADVLRDAASIIGDELAALAAEGVPYLQLDNPHYPDYISDDRRSEWRELGVDAESALADDIAADNASLARLDRARVTVGMHLCRGNGPMGQWHTAGGYERIAEQVFGGLDVDRFLLEYDSERAGGFEPLRFMPRGKLVVLGLVTTKSAAMESQDELLRRIDEASRYVPVERSGAQSAVWLRFHAGRQSTELGRSASQAGTCGGDGAARLGLTLWRCRDRIDPVVARHAFIQPVLSVRPEKLQVLHGSSSVQALHRHVLVAAGVFGTDSGCPARPTQRRSHDRSRTDRRDACSRSVGRTQVPTPPGNQPSRTRPSTELDRSSRRAVTPRTRQPATRRTRAHR